MEKPDLEDWEFLTEESFLDIPPPGRSKSPAISRQLGFGGRRGGLVDVNYFVCPPHHPPHLIVAAPQDLIPPIKSEEAQDEVVVKEIRMVESPEVISQVFFRKLGENEFVDMKLDSPTSKSTLFEVPRYEEDKREKAEEEEVEREEKGGERRDEVLVSAAMDGKNGSEGFGFGIWKWKVAGFGAICSIGVAAATIFIFVLSGSQRQMQQHRQKAQFQMYPDEKSIKQVVQQATRLNQAISVVRGVPMTRAHISFGGYYDGL